MIIKLQRINKDLPTPKYQTADSAGVDLCASLGEDEFIEIPIGGRALIPTGIKIVLPKGYEMQIRPRSGIALKYGITVCNAPGTIDSDYRGEIGVILINHGNEAFYIQKGDRIAQAVFCQFQKVTFEEIDVIHEDTERGNGGFGHTGN